MKFYIDSKYNIHFEMRYDILKVVDKNLRFMAFFFLNKLFAYIFVHIFQTVEDMTKIKQYAAFEI